MSAPPTRIVVAEDEAIIRLDLVETLVEEGYEVVAETGRGDDALRLVHELAPDLAILDVRMPGLDGIEVAREIVETRAAAVLILTAVSALYHVLPTARLRLRWVLPGALLVVVLWSATATASSRMSWNSSLTTPASKSDSRI